MTSCFYPKFKMENEVSIKVTIWNEGRHEKLHSDVAAIYPSGIHGAIAAGLKTRALQYAAPDSTIPTRA